MDSELRTMDSGLWILDSGFWTLDSYNLLSTYLVNKKQNVQFEFSCSKMLDVYPGIPLIYYYNQRYICYTKYNAHTEPLFNVLKFNDLYKTKLLICYHKLLNNITSYNF